MVVPYKICFVSRAGISSHMLETGDAFCCLANRTNVISCEQCDGSCNHTIRVVCQTCEEKCFKPSPTRSSLPINQCSNIIIPLGSVSGVLLAVLVATLVGWTVTCVVWRSKSTNRRKFLK